MRFEIVLVLVAGFLILNVYTEGKMLKRALSFKKYYQMLGIAVIAFIVYWLIKHNPLYARQILTTSNDYVKYLPVDKNTADMISPILDFTAKHSFSKGDGAYSGSVAMPNVYERKVMTSGLPTGGARAVQQDPGLGRKATKRSVSETKKKFVASRQNWKCGDCQTQLNAWFEVDHKVRLEYGGSNHVDNLVALCRECHGKKTTIENL